MRQHIKGSFKANEIKMLLNHPSYKNKLFIILEGKTDICLFRSLLKSDCFSIESVDGKRDLIKVIKDIREDDNGCVVGICDADFDHIDNLVHHTEMHGIYLTDTHDAEIMLFNSPSLEAFIDEFSERKSHQELTDNLRTDVLNAAYKIGLLRLINSNEKLNLCWKGLNFNSFISIEKLSISVDMEQLIEDLIKRSPNICEGNSKQSIMDLYNQRNSDKYCQLQICCGHDVSNITAMIYSQRWASNIANINKKQVESSLRVGYTLEYFKCTTLYKKLVNAIEKFGFSLIDVDRKLQFVPNSRKTTA